MPTAASWYGRFKKTRLSELLQSAYNEFVMHVDEEGALESFLQPLCLCTDTTQQCHHDKQKGRINYAKQSQWSPVTFIHFAQSVGILGISHIHKIKQRGGFSCIPVSILSLVGEQPPPISQEPPGMFLNITVLRQCLF